MKKQIEQHQRENNILKNEKDNIASQMKTQ